MKVALCNTKLTARGSHLLSVFRDGLERHGDTSVWLDALDVKTLLECDVAIQVCVANMHHQRRSAHAIFRQDLLKCCEKYGKRLLSVETGFVSNQHELEMRNACRTGRFEKLEFNTEQPETFEETQNCIYYELGYDGLKRHASYHNENSPPDRWKSLGVPIAPWVGGHSTEGEYILILGQPLFGASSAHVDVLEWYRDSCKVIRSVTDRPIVFRQHPRLFKRPARAKKVMATKAMQAVLKMGATVSKNVLLQDDLDNAHSAVVFSSNAGVTSVLAGVPTFVGDEFCMAWDVGNKDFLKIEDPEYPDREQWAWNLAYAQWNCAEMKSGEAWAHLRPHASFS